MAPLPCAVLLLIVSGPESSFADSLILSLPGQKTFTRHAFINSNIFLLCINLLIHWTKIIFHDAWGREGWPVVFGGLIGFVCF